MENYTLQENEVVLYKGEEISCAEKRGFWIELILTNIALVLIVKKQKLFGKGQVFVETYPVQDIKVYNGIPQIKQQGAVVELYLLGGEQTLEFPSKKEAHKFAETAVELLTGKTAFERGVDKTKDTVATVDGALGINTVGTVKNVFDGALGVYSQNGKNNVLKSVFNVMKGAISTKEEKTQQSIENNQTETLKKWKELLDSGIITQEEFDLKKREILGL